MRLYMNRILFFCLVPAVLLTNFYHGCQNVVPGLSFGHNLIREHAAIPANMFESFGQLPVFIAQPVTGIVNYIEFTVGVQCLAMPSRCIVRPRTEHGSVVLGNVKVDCPGT